MKVDKKKLWVGCGLFALFVMWTALVLFVDVNTIGPEESSVGFATVNGWFHRCIGLHLHLYTLTDWLSLVPVGLPGMFGVMGLLQWIKRKRIPAVDRSILTLGVLYAVTAAAFLFFEMFPVNYRPVLLNGVLEASYPSSTTMLVMCIVPTAAMDLKDRIRNRCIASFVFWILMGFAFFMIVCRLLSGVHWLTDIVGGLLFGGGIIAMYNALNFIK